MTQQAWILAYHYPNRFNHSRRPARPKMKAIPMNQPVPKKSFVDWLNHECFCMSLDRTALNNAMAQEVDDPAFLEKLIADRTHLFSNVPLFLSLIHI